MLFVSFPYPRLNLLHNRALARSLTRRWPEPELLIAETITFIRWQSLRNASLKRRSDHAPPKTSSDFNLLNIPIEP